MLPSVPQQEHHPTVWSRTGISPVLSFFRVIHAFGRPVSPIAKRCPVLLRSWKLQIKQPGSSSQMRFCTSPLHAVKPTALRMLWMPAAWMDLKNQREIPGLKTHWRLLETGGFKEPPSAGRGKTTPGNSFSWVLPSSREAIAGLIQPAKLCVHLFLPKQVVQMIISILQMGKQRDAQMPASVEVQTYIFLVFMPERQTDTP